jgi:hypothetical protein
MPSNNVTTTINIEAYEDTCGDPCYYVRGHVDITEFERQLGLMTDYGEDAESASEYHYTHCYAIADDASERWPDGGWKVVPPDTPGAYPITLAATWIPRVPI